MEIKKNEIWKVKSRMFNGTIKVLEDIKDIKEDMFFEAEIVEDIKHYLSPNIYQEKKGEKLSFRTTLTAFIKKINKMKFEIKLIDIGRKKINQEYKIDAEDLMSAANLVYARAKMFLASSNTSLEPDEDDEEKWTLLAGFRPVGIIKIKELK